jgi:hypothetical protein
MPYFLHAGDRSVHDRVAASLAGVWDVKIMKGYLGLLLPPSSANGKVFRVKQARIDGGY